MAKQSKLSQRIGFFVGILVFVLVLLMKTPTGMEVGAKITIGLLLWMAIWWATEAVPLPITSLLPLLIFPLFKVISAKDIAKSYMSQEIMLFVGGFFISEALEESGLHERLSLFLINKIGTSPKRIILAFMIAVGFISMWISNTTATVMALPIALSIIEFYKELIKKEGLNVDTTPGEFKFATALMLGVAFAASIGGMGTPIGTPPNIIFLSMAKQMFPNAPTLSFLEFSKFGILFIIFFLPFTWFMLTSVFFKPGFAGLKESREIFANELKKLGKMLIKEKVVLTVFLITVFLWIFRTDIDFGNFTIKGWSNILGISKYVHDSTVAILAALLLYIIPVDFKKGETVLNAESVKKLPWDIILIFGGGLAIADAMVSTKVADYVGSKLTFLSGVNLLWVIALVGGTGFLIAQFTSHTSATSIFMPIAGAVAVAAKIHPYLVMLPTTFAISLAFSLPASTPPNVVVMTGDYVKVKDMLKAGFIIGFLGLIILVFYMYFVGIPLLNIANMPY
ncbi:SLC13 family permease [Caldisericum sp.]|uniref:SLC13 family permease n=1 Tax=Caldisericum sp. TaxID=2499687 RepID=UPI003D0B8B04